MLSKDEEIRMLLKTREIDWECIRAMQNRAEKFFIIGLLWRKPWKSSRPWIRKGDTFLITCQNIISFIKYAHDCQDPAVACSCYGGFRFPGPTEDK